MNARNLMPSAVLAACMIAAAWGAGCTGEREARVPVSGNPEADRRADLRVGAADGPARGGRTLYERLGGTAGIAAIVEDSTDRFVADPRVNFERRNVQTNWLGAKYDAWDPSPQSLEQFKRHMVEFLALAAGGPTEYAGRDMRTVHEGMRITNNEFDAMVGDIKASMDRLGIGPREQRDLLAIIETTRKQIVEEP